MTRMWRCSKRPHDGSCRNPPIGVQESTNHDTLPEGFMPLPSFAVSAQGAVNEVQGTLMADLVGLPVVWPPGLRAGGRPE